MKARERSGTIIKRQRFWKVGKREYGKNEVYQPLSFLIERFGSDWVYGNNFVRVEVGSHRVVLKLGVKKNKYKEIDLSREGAIRMAKLILAEYESKQERFNKQ